MLLDEDLFCCVCRRFFRLRLLFRLFFSSRFAIIYLNVSRAAIMARNTEEAMMIDLAYSSCHLD